MNGKEQKKSWQNENLPQNAEELLECLNHQERTLEITKDELDPIWGAYAFTKEVDKGRTRESTDSNLTDYLAIAQTLAKYNLDSETICTALLYNLVKYDVASVDDIEARFGKNIASLVKGVIGLDRYFQQQNNVKKLESLFITAVSDIRIVFIQLAKRLQLVRTLHGISQQEEQEIAMETLEVFARLAERLGIWEIKSELEDFSFRYINPEAFHQIATEIQRIQEEKHEILDNTVKNLKTTMGEYGLSVEEFVVTTRPKHLYSIYKKMHTPKYVGKGVERIYDKLGIRVIVNTVAECYEVLGIVHSIWTSIPGEYDDYIRSPTQSGYRSLHTAVRLSGEKHDVIEFQIRTHEMHDEAEYGIAAHWRYKEKVHHSKALARKTEWLRQVVLGLKRGEDLETLLANFSAELPNERIVVHTPKGEPIELAAGTTPIDFAYQIHTQVGHRCRGARVNGKMVSLDYKLKSGDRVEILTTNRGGPSRDWMNSSLGYTGSARTRSKIRQWFREQEWEQNIEQGREVVERELRRLGLSETYTIEDIALALKYHDVEQFLAKVGFGDIQSTQISGAIARLQDDLRPDDELRPLLQEQSKTKGLTVLGVSGLYTKMAGCCDPIPPEPIIGYVTRGQGVTIHRQDCKQVQAINEQERLIEVNWGMETEAYPIPIVIKAYRRPDLIEDIVNILRGQQLSVPKTKTTTTRSLITIYLVVEVDSLDRLNWLLQKFESLPNVIEAHRQRWS